jgi:branched-chain amino acid transport system permease protein
MLHTLIIVLFFTYMAVSWNIVCGYVGQLSLGHSAFAGIGGYVSTLLFINLGLTPWIGMFLGGFVAMFVGVAIGYPCFRLRGPYFALTTIAFAELLRIWVENTESFLGIEIKGAMGLLVPLKGHSPGLFQFDNKEPYYLIILAMLILALLATWWLERNRLGYYLKAIKGDQDGAEAIGVNSTRYMLTAMAISAFLTGMGGCFYAQFFRYINPERILGIDLSIEVALIGIVGGQGTLWGPVLGACLLTPASEILRSLLGGKLLGLHLLFYGLVLVLAIFFLPKGLIEPVRAFAAKIGAISNGKKFEVSKHQQDELAQ